MNAIEGAAIEHQSSLGRLRFREVDLGNMRVLVIVDLVYPVSDRLVSPQLRVGRGAAHLPQKLKGVCRQIVELIAFDDINILEEIFQCLL